MHKTINFGRRNFLCAATGLALSGLTNAALPTFSNLGLPGTEGDELISHDRHLDLRTANELAKDLLAEDGLGILYLDAFASASVEALEYLASIERAFLLMNRRSMERMKLAGFCGWNQRQNSSPGDTKTS